MRTQQPKKLVRAPNGASMGHMVFDARVYKPFSMICCFPCIIY